MRFKKSQIGEIVDTSRTTDGEVNIKIDGDLPKPEDIQKSKSEIEALNQQISNMNTDIENSPMSAFITKGDVNEVVNSDKVVEYVGDMPGETPFKINDDKWLYVKGKYPDGKVDIAVYRYGHDITYDYNWFMSEIIPKPIRFNESILNRKVIKNIKIKDIKK